jgi:hypothetical protein
MNDGNRPIAYDEAFRRYDEAFAAVEGVFRPGTALSDALTELCWATDEILNASIRRALDGATVDALEEQLLRGGFGS